VNRLAAVEPHGNRRVLSVNPPIPQGRQEVVRTALRPRCRRGASRPRHQARRAVRPSLVSAALTARRICSHEQSTLGGPFVRAGFSLPIVSIVVGAGFSRPRQAGIPPGGRSNQPCSRSSARTRSARMISGCSPNRDSCVCVSSPSSDTRSSNPDSWR